MKTFFEAHIWTLRGKLYRISLSLGKGKGSYQRSVVIAFREGLEKKGGASKNG
jgi:stalled ribosome alternative rescue factor ArfA